MSMLTITKLGILAGGGSLPKQLVEHCKRSGIPCFVLAFEESYVVPSASPSSCDDHIHADVITPIGHIGSGLAALKEAGVSELVLAGHMKRPSFRKLNLDDQAKKLLKKLGTKILGGDDALLKALMSFLEDEGFTILAAHEILGGMTIGAGIATKQKPDAEHATSIEKAMHMLNTISPLDVGQALVIEDEYVLGIEAAEGTDGLIARSASYMKTDKRAILVKAKKAGQDTRADMPTIGPNTIEQLAQHGYAGVAIEANNVLIVDKDKVIELANQHQLFITAVAK